MAYTLDAKQQIREGGAGLLMLSTIIPESQIILHRYTKIKQQWDDYIAKIADPFILLVSPNPTKKMIKAGHKAAAAMDLKIINNPHLWYQSVREDCRHAVLEGPMVDVLPYNNDDDDDYDITMEELGAYLEYIGNPLLWKTLDGHPIGPQIPERYEEPEYKGPWHV